MLRRISRICGASVWGRLALICRFHWIFSKKIDISADAFQALHPVLTALADIPAFAISEEDNPAASVRRLLPPRKGAMSLWRSITESSLPLSRLTMVRHCPNGCSIFRHKPVVKESAMSITNDRKAELIAEFGSNDKDSGKSAVQVAILTERIA